MLRLTSLGSLFLVALASGCGNNVDHASAVKVMNSALSGTIAAGGQVVSVETNANGGTVDASLTNLLGGGTAHVTGTVTHNGNMTTIDVDVTFKDWTDPLAHVTLNGALHEAGTFASPLPTAGDIDLSGALAVTGDVNATVDFDLHGKYSPTGLSVNGDVGGQSILNVQIGTP
jgi:hypothetical protein